MFFAVMEKPFGSDSLNDAHLNLFLCILSGSGLLGCNAM
jgi:hypothetical protein